MVAVLTSSLALPSVVSISEKTSAPQIFDAAHTLYLGDLRFPTSLSFPFSARGPVTESSSVTNREMPVSGQSISRHLLEPAVPAYSATEALKKIATAPAVVAGLGSTIVTIPLSPINAAIFGATTVMSAVNELRMGQKPHCPAESATKQATSGGVLGYLKEKMLSPGFCAWLQAGCFVGNMVVALKTSQYTKACVMGSFVAGELAGTEIANRDYRPPAREKLWFERLARSVWNSLPERCRTVLSDPGAMFCMGNLALVVKDLDLIKLSSSGAGGVCFATGCLLASLGVLRGIAPLFGVNPKPSGNASLIGGIGDHFLGISSILAGNAYTGAATILWGIANLLYAQRVGSPLISGIGRLIQRFIPEKAEASAFIVNDKPLSGVASWGLPATSFGSR